MKLFLSLSTLNILTNLVILINLYSLGSLAILASDEYLGDEKIALIGTIETKSMKNQLFRYLQAIADLLVTSSSFLS
jgi:hypothetical protein